MGRSAYPLEELEQLYAKLEADADEALRASEEVADHGLSYSRRQRWAPVSLQPRSANRKLAPQASEKAKSGRTRFVPIGPYVASTYASIKRTCPSSCPFKAGGCYAKAGSAHLTMGKLDQAGRSMSALEVTRYEANLLSDAWVNGVPQDGHRGGRDLRLHVGGDVSCTRGARALAQAVAGLECRGLGAAWSFTARWRQIPKAAFGSISVLASVVTTAAAMDAIARGWVPAIAMVRFPSDRQWSLADGWKVQPCPAELGSLRGEPTPTTCAQCRLCLDQRTLRRRKLAIAFAAHGPEADVAAASIVRRGGSRHV